MAKSSQKTARRKQGGKGKPFAKGQSGNPKGRPLQTVEEKEVRALAQSKSLHCIDRLEDLAGGSGMTAVRANEILLERAWGKPKQEVELAGGRGGLLIMLPPEDGEG